MMDSDAILMESIKLPLVEDFYTLQGEGRYAGQAAYFIRLGGCDVGCKWCDAKFTWRKDSGEMTSVDEIVERATSFPARNIVITGGEPTLYDLNYLTSELHRRGMKVFIETSGTGELQGHFDWVCLSPKRQELPLEHNFQRASELKVIVSSMEDIEFAEQCARQVPDSTLLYLQSEWSVRAEMMPVISDYIMKNTRWRMSLQSHKYIGIP